ncbi:MAG: hypothetical protein G01um101438_923 [Parcubacteria group bacterium Gr01-1014_38]|nr:MAG: hypothetical protein G01um101438_923 [Parcubacteria group bacterium Gr01-1014_38]
MKNVREGTVGYYAAVSMIKQKIEDQLAGLLQCTWSNEDLQNLATVLARPCELLKLAHGQHDQWFQKNGRSNPFSVYGLLDKPKKHKALEEMRDILLTAAEAEVYEPAVQHLRDVIARVIKQRKAARQERQALAHV